MIRPKENEDEETVCFSINGMEDNTYYLSESLCSRIVCIGMAYKLRYVPMIEIYGDIKFNKIQVLSLIEELLFIQSVVNDALIENIVPCLIGLLQKITKSRNEDILWIIGN